MRYFLAALIVVLSVFDMISTEMLVNRIGIHVEANPFMRSIMVNYGMTVTYIVRLAIAVVGTSALVYFYSDSPKLTLGCLWLAAFVHLLIVAHHLIIWDIINV